MSSSSCERNWSSYSFVHSKARNRLHSSCAEVLVYVYTNSRVLNQNATSTDEGANEWYKQTIVSEDFDSDEPLNIMDEYDGVLHIHATHVEVNGVFTEDTHTEEHLREHIATRAFIIGEQGRDLEDWVVRHASAPHPGAPTDDGDTSPIIEPQRCGMLINSDDIRYSGQ
jgi:hypothetical protein